MFVTRLGTDFVALISDGGNALITASSLISSCSCHKVVAEVGRMHKLFCRSAEDSYQRDLTRKVGQVMRACTKGKHLTLPRTAFVFKAVQINDDKEIR